MIFLVLKAKNLSSVTIFKLLSIVLESYDGINKSISMEFYLIVKKGYHENCTAVTQFSAIYTVTFKSCKCTISSKNIY